nr:pseudouridylate synthase [Candidatus Cloacimonadota bacterium]
MAMESTVITHGLPYPQNFEILSELEDLAEENGAIPATICILDGVIRIGLDSNERNILRNKIVEHAPIHKIALRDIPLSLAKRESGGTTVSATMALAHRVGIKVFATGGIGGVHRRWQESLDISLDIKALSEISMIVVSAGCKAILDIAATLELLETSGVSVYGWQCDEFPAFYSRTSGCKITRVDGLQTIADTFRISREFSQGALLIANPIPGDFEIPAFEIEPYIQSGLQAATAIHGKDLTPFLLNYLAEATEGRSVKANLALLRNNVILGAKLAKELI